MKTDKQNVFADINKNQTLCVADRPTYRPTYQAGWLADWQDNRLMPTDLMYYIPDKLVVDKLAGWFIGWLVHRLVEIFILSDY